jgi:hypothetical protein
MEVPLFRYEAYRTKNVLSHSERRVENSGHRSCCGASELEIPSSFSMYSDAKSGCNLERRTTDGSP